MGLAEDAAREAAAEAPMGSVVAFNPSPTARWDNGAQPRGSGPVEGHRARAPGRGHASRHNGSPATSPCCTRSGWRAPASPVAPPTAPRSRALRTAAQPDDHRGPDGHIRGRRGGRPDLARPRRAEERARGGDERRGRRGKSESSPVAARPSGQSACAPAGVDGPAARRGGLGGGPGTRARTSSTTACSRSRSPPTGQSRSAGPRVSADSSTEATRATATTTRRPRRTTSSRNSTTSASR